VRWVRAGAGRRGGGVLGGWRDWAFAEGMAMSRVVVVGATGHIGTYLVPRLVRGGHEVIAMSRGAREPYHASPEWGLVARVTVDRDGAAAIASAGTSR